MKTFTNLAQWASKCASLSTFNKKRYYLFIIMLLTIGVGSAWAESIYFEGFEENHRTSGNNSYTADAKTYGDWTLKYADAATTGSPLTGTANVIMRVAKNTINSPSLVSGALLSNTYNVTKVSWNSKGNTAQMLKVSYSTDGSTWTEKYSAALKTSKTANNFTLDNIPGPIYLKFVVSVANSTSSNRDANIDDITIEGIENSSSDPDEPTCTTITPTLTYSSISLLTGATAAATLEGNSGNGEVTYTTSDNKIATVDANGTVTAEGAGTATITANIAAAGGYCEGKATATITVTPLVSCSEIYNLADDAKFALKEFEVTYVNGKYAYIKDDTGYGLIFNNAGEYGLKAGDQVASTKFEGKKDTYNGLVEIVPITTFANLELTSGTAPDPEVMNALPVKADMNKYVKFEDVTFASTAFSSKKVTGKINAGNITFYDQFATNATFNTSKKYDVIGAVSIYNSTIQVNFISAEEVAEPTLNVKITDADFGKVAINDSHERTLTLNGSLLTKPVTLTIEGDYFTLASNSITPTDGSISEAKIKITYKPTVEGNHTATLKITSDELAEQTITLRGQAVQQHTVDFYVNKEKQTELAKKVLSGDKLDAMPAEPTSCDQLEYPTFIGWSTSEITGTTTEEPTNLLDLNTVITSDCSYYAVFAKSTTTGSAEDTETITKDNFGNGDGTQRVYDAISATWTWNKGTGSAIATTYDEIRLYANHSLTISPKAGYTITKIVAAISENKYVTPFAAGGLTGATSSADGLNVTLTPTGGDIVITQAAQSRVTSFTITYAAASTENTYLTTCESVTPTYAVTYNLDGGSSTCETSVVVEKDGELTLCDAPTKTGYTFLKWKDQSDNEYEAGATITVSSDLILTAKWQIESYKVTWMSLGIEVTSTNVEYNTQPTKPATDPTYTCLSATKEFVGWTTQEINGVGVPVDLYIDNFPAVTESITYYAVFAGKSAEASIVTNTLLVTEKLGNYTSGSMKDDQQNVWNYFAGGLEDAGTYYLALRNNNGETTYIESPNFAGTVQSIVAHVKNGSASKVRTVYLRSSAIEKPTEGDLGETSIPASNNSDVTLNITSSFNKFFIQVSDGLQFHKIEVTSGIAAGAYIDYITSCEAVTASIAIDDITLNVGETHNITATITPSAAENAISYSIKENTANAISLSGNTITALAEGTATITATIEDAANYAGVSVDFTVIVNPAPVTDKVVILAQYDGQWYAMKAEYLSSDKTDRLVAVAINYADGKLYNIPDEDKALIEWERTTSVDKVSFQNNGKYLKGKTTTILNLEAGATGLYQWDRESYTMVLEGSSTLRTFMYNGEAFRNFAVTNAGQVKDEILYSSLPEVVAPVYATGDVVTTATVTIEDPIGSMSTYTGVEENEGVWSKVCNIGEEVTIGIDELGEGWLFAYWTVGEEKIFTEEYTFTVTEDITITANYGMAMDVEFDNMELDQESWVVTAGPEAGFGIELTLGIDVEGEHPKGFGLVEGSSISLGGNELELVTGYFTSVDLDAPSAEAVVFAIHEEMLMAFVCTMTAAPAPTHNIVVENATIDNQTGKSGFLFMNGTWSDGTETYPVKAEIPGFDVSVASATYAVTVTVGGQGDEDPWLGSAEGEATVTVNNGLVTLTGSLANAWTGFKADVTVSGTLAKDYTRAIEEGNFGTICLPYGAQFIGAELYELVGKDDKGVYLGEVTTLEAGVPYIFRATATELVAYKDGTTATEAGKHNGLVGTFVDNTVVEVGNYILSGNKLCQAEAICYVNANRAYVVWDEVPAGAPVQMPGRRYIGMDVQGENGTTGLDNIVAPEGQLIKTIENGQLIIIRNGEMYNAQGQKL